ncbi:hypothetical protein [uncultured Pontibacter sp.]|uniref:hypothetical protein n=1 Tax=uncultured Pontibacter sp. TaxID=453356 RepID=UPI00261A7987|nr:hypothetical protein [uncultured Pontibacter sp.]
MKLLLALLLVCSCLGCSSHTKHTTTSEPSQPLVLVTDTLLKFEAQPTLGFNFDYLIYLPKGIKSDSTTHLLVETNNTGLNDSIEYHERGARHAASKSGVGIYISKRLRIPFLVPIFPRSETNWTFYTHALDRDVLLTKEPDIERLDLQLLAMVEDAKKQLAARGYPIKEKFFMTGFSASGTFANRFSLLHPDKVKATAYGGINAIPILPVSEWEGNKLPYPLGIADMEEITGQPVDIAGFRQLPKMLFMGALDDNDAVRLRRCL